MCGYISDNLTNHQFQLVKYRYKNEQKTEKQIKETTQQKQQQQQLYAKRLSKWTKY